MIAAIRVRGSVNVREKTEKTMDLLNLPKPNYLILIQENSEQQKTIKKAENYITWGEINTENFAKILEKKAVTKQGKKIDKQTLEKNKVKSFKELAEKIEKKEITLQSLGIKPFFRMRPPRKGYGRQGIKKSFKIGGALGYRGKDINILIKRML